MEAHGWKIGDLVWTRVQGYPWWPGQVMDPEQASSKVREGRRDDRILVCFFGDNEYGWNPADWLVPFQEHYAEKRLQKGTKGHRKFHRAVEEAKEVQDRRSGLQPETNHEPVDFLDPSTFPSSESEDDSRDDSLAPTADLRIPPLRKDDAAHVVPIQALNFLMAAACGDSIALNKIGAESAKLCRQLLASLAAQRLLAEDNDASLGAKQRSRAKPLLCHLTKGPKRKLPGSRLEDGEDVDSAQEAKQPKKRKALVELREDEAESMEEEEEDEEEREEEEPPEAARQELPGLVLCTKLAKVAGFLRGTAATFVPGPRLSSMLKSNATEVAATLRFREKVYCCSEHNQVAGEEGEDRRWRQQQRGTCIGEALLEALAAPGLRTAKQPPARGSGRERGPAADAAREEEQGRGGKRRQGIIVDIPDVSKGGRHREYAVKVPEGQEAFMQALTAFYAEYETDLPKPVVDKQELDLYTLFKIVAERGGYEAVTMQRQWLAVTLAWRPELREKKSTSIMVRKNYERVLLAFEQRLSAGAPERLISSTWGAKSASKREAKAQRQAEQGTDAATKAAKKAAKKKKALASSEERVKDEDRGSLPDKDASATKPVKTILDERSSSSSSSESEAAASEDSESAMSLKTNGSTAHLKKARSTDEGKASKLSEGQRAQLQQLKKKRQERQERQHMAYSKLDEDPEPQPPPAAAKPPRPPSDVAGAARAKAPKKLASGKLPLPQAKSQRPLPKEVPKRKESGKTMLMIYLPEGHTLPSPTQVWMRMKKFQKNDALSIENIIVNKKLYLISIKYGTAEEAAKAHNSLDSMAEVFHAKRDMVRFRLETPRAKPPPDASSVRPSSAAASASPAPAAAVPAPPAAASQAPSDPRRPVSGQAPGQAGQSSGQSSGQQPSKPGQLPQAQPVVIPVDPRKAAAAAKTTVIGDPRLFQNRVLSGAGQSAQTSSYMAATPLQPQPYSQPSPAMAAPSYGAPAVNPVDPRKAAAGYASNNGPAFQQQQQQQRQQQPPVDPRAKIEAIRAAIAAQTAAAPPPPPPLQPQAQQPATTPAPFAAAPADPRVRPQAPPPASTGAAAPAAKLAVGALDLFSILQNAGVKPVAGSAPPSSSAGPSSNGAPQPESSFPQGQAAAVPLRGGDAGRAAVPADGQKNSAAGAPPGKAPDIAPQLMQLLGKMSGSSS